MITPPTASLRSPVRRGPRVRGIWAWARLAGGVAILAVLVWRLGTGPFVDGLQTINAWSLLAATSITLLTTVVSAWRWTIVARGLGVGIPLPTAIAAYYRSQFLNTALPGGVLGDVHRGVRHGQDVGDVGRGLRAVAWERTAGQAVQAALTVCVLLAMPSPVHSVTPTVLMVAVPIALGLIVITRALPRNGLSRTARILRAAEADIHEGLLPSQAWPGIAVASALALAGHTTIFLVAARTAGTTSSTLTLVPLAMLSLLASAVPTNIGGWGPREGVAAWLFAAAGLGADQGVATATVFGVMGLVASLPGAVVLLVAWWRRRARATKPTLDVPAPPLEAALHG
jgi:glycosyltransferase 2 family protein